MMTDSAERKNISEQRGHMKGDTHKRENMDETNVKKKEREIKKGEEQDREREREIDRER